MPLDRAAELQLKNARLRGVIVDLLEAPHLGGPAPAIARTNACYEVGHPKITAEGGCACGKKK